MSLSTLLLVSLFAAIILYALYFIYVHNPSLNYKQLNGKNIILTGASTGIGEQMAYELAKGKANLIITGLEQNLLQSVATKCKQLGASSIECIAIDLSSTSNCRRFVEQCLSIFKSGQIDYLFLNHALIGPYQEWINARNLASFDVEKNIGLIEKTMPININSHMIISTLLYPYLERNSAKIVYTSSLAGYGIQPYVSVYSASKHGISAFFENWRTELAINTSKVSITICKLAMVATNASISTAGPVLSEAIVQRAASPNYVARRIISGGQHRLKFVYAPFLEGMAVGFVSKISTTLYTAITCKVNYGRFW